MGLPITLVDRCMLYEKTRVNFWVQLCSALVSPFKEMFSFQV